MEEKTFRRFEKICKGMWTKLSKNGRQEKPNGSSAFYLDCPACHIAHCMRETNKDYKWRLCKHCPITFWRSRRYKTVSCEQKGKKGIFKKWYRSYNIETRKALAAQIAKLEWKFLPEYSQIPEKEMLEVLKKYEEFK